MGLLSGIGSALGGLLFGGVGAVLGGRKKREVIQPRAVRRDEMAENIEADDALRRRQGAAADIITGTRGAQAASGSIGRLVVGS